MAPIKNKEAIILAIDVGKNSSLQDSDGKTFLEKSLFCASMILKRKLLSENKDDLALILFGSSITNNSLSSRGSYFQNIEIVSNLGVITWDLLQFITNISSTDVKPSDWLSTLVIATDILKNENESKVFTALQIVMFSNFTDDISLDHIDSLITSIQHLDIRLTMIGKDCDDIPVDLEIGKFITETKATAVDFDSVIPQLSHYKTKEVSPRAWNIPLEFGNCFSIRVIGYKKIDEIPKGFKWILCKNYDTPDSLTPLIKHTSYYYEENDVQVQIDRDNIINGYRFGDTIIPVSELDTDAFGYKSGPKSLQVLGFTKAKNIQRSFLMDGGSYIFKPNEEDYVAFGAIFKAMVEREEIMIVRKVYLANCMPNICAMFPQTEDDKNFFVLVNLPYAEDEHLFKLPSLKSFKPSDDQKNAVCNLINAMDLNDDEDTLFMPENTYNPELQFMYNCIAEKALNKDKLLTDAVPTFIQSLSRPPQKMMEKAQQPINDLKNLFSFGKIINNKNVLNDSFPLKNENNEEKEIKKTCVITAYSPVEDFNKLLEEGIDSKLVCQTMKKLLVELIESSSSLEELKKPASILMALRKFYIHNNDVNVYNTWMYHVKDSVLLSGKEEMWSQFIDSGIGLITNQEVESSEVSQEQSEEYMKHDTNYEDIIEDFIIDDDDPLKEFL